MAAELLHKLEKLADATSMEGLNGHLGAPIPLNETLLAFDFDQTLSYLPIIEFNVCNFVIINMNEIILVFEKKKKKKDYSINKPKKQTWMNMTKTQTSGKILENTLK